MILSDIRLLVGIHVGQKGFPPSIIAPVINILSLLDEELVSSAFVPSPQLEKEAERLKNAIVVMNYDPSDEDEDDISDDLALDDMMADDDDEEEEEDDSFLNTLDDDDDE